MNAASRKFYEANVECNVDVAERAGDETLNTIATEPRRGYYDDLRAYMAPFQKYPTLTKPEDYEYLFERYWNGDETEKLRARDLLVYGNIKLVLKIAFFYTGRGLPLLDLLQEGVIGLMTAIQEFDIKLGFRFSTYAFQWIRQAMTRALYDRNEREPYRIPVHYRDLMQLTRRVCGQLYLTTGRWPKEVQVYERIKVDGTKIAERLKLADVVKLMRAISAGEGTLRLDDPSQNSNRDETVGDLLNVGPPKTETVVEARRLYAEYKQAIERIGEAVD